jgi:hypothetical protein
MPAGSSDLRGLATLVRNLQLGYECLLGYECQRGPYSTCVERFLLAKVEGPNDLGYRYPSIIKIEENHTVIIVGSYPFLYDYEIFTHWVIEKK